VTKPLKLVINLVIFPCAAVVLLIPVRFLAQILTTPVRDPNAISLASKALQAMAGATALRDITLEASATYTAGSDQEIGPATLVALGNQLSLVKLSLTSGQRQEIRNELAGVWVGPDGTAHAMTADQCWVDADWFFPALMLTALSSDATLGIFLVGEEVRAEEAVYHLSLSHTMPSLPADSLAVIQHRSAMDLYLDAKTLLPAALDFNTHPDVNSNVDIPVEIRFGVYQPFNGVMTPTIIQKYLQGSQLLNLGVTNVAVNSGVSPAAFTLPITSTGGAQ
jgi:hypothetical protein